MRHTSQGSGDAVVNETKFFEFNAKAGGPFRLYVGGIEQPGFHIQEREAAERAGNLKLANPSDSVTYRHDYEVEAVLTTAGLAIAIDYAPTADSPPQITSTPNPFFVQGTPGTYDFKQNYTDDGNSPVIHAVTNVLPGGLQLNQNTGILSYDGAGVASVSQHALIVTDSVGSAQSATFNIAIRDDFEDYSDLESNVENYGVVMNGVTNNDAAWAVAVDADTALFVPPGESVFASTTTITKPLLVKCFGQSIRSNVPKGGPRNFKYLGQQVRFMATADVPAFRVRNLVAWQGGVVDYQNVSLASSPAFDIPMDWLGGELGGSIKYFSMFGLETTIEANDVDGGQAIYVDFAGQTTDGARLENWNFQVECRYVHTVFRITALNPGYNQNSALLRVTSDHFKSNRSVYDEASNQSAYMSIMQVTANIWNSEALNDATHQMDIGGSNNRLWDLGVHDFDTTGQEPSRPHRAINVGDANYVVQLPNGWEAGYAPVFGTPAIEQIISDVEMVLGSVS